MPRNSDSPLTAAQIDYVSVLHAVHRLSGIATPANVAYSAAELEHQLRSSGAKALFTCVPALETALTAAKAVGIPNDKIFILDLPHQSQRISFKTVDDLVELGRSLPDLEPLRWVKGQGERQTALLCYSSGTSGLPVSPSLPLFLHRQRSTADPKLESCDDLTSKCHCQRDADCFVRGRRT